MRWQVDTPQNLAQFLADRLSESGKSVRRKLEARLCRLNGQVERFGSRKLIKGDLLEIAPHWRKEEKKGQARLEAVVYEDDDLVIFDKPAGFTCDAGIKLPRFLFWVHRLDRETSGVLVTAKRVKVQEVLFGLFSTRRVEKEYLALVDGVPNRLSGVIDTKLARKRSFGGQTIWGSTPHEGKRALTRWECALKGEKAALIRCFPETGRTHQIRVHLSEMGHPILGDRQYAASFRCPFFAPRVLLHSEKVAFIHEGKQVNATAPLPDDLRKAIVSQVASCGF